MEIQPRHLTALEACENINELMKKVRYFKKKGFLTIALFEAVLTRATALIGSRRSGSGRRLRSRKRLTINGAASDKYWPKLDRLTPVGYQEYLWSKEKPRRQRALPAEPKPPKLSSLERELKGLATLTKERGSPLHRAELSNLLVGVAQIQDARDLERLSAAIKQLKEDIAASQP